MKKIVLIGGYGFSDVGDESQLTVDLINLKKFIPDAQFLVLSSNPEHTRKHHMVKTDYSINLFLRTPILVRRIERILKINPYVWVNFLLKSLIILLNARRLMRNKKPVFLSARGKRFLENLRGADLLFNVGGGNLNSMFRFEEFYGKCLTYVLCRIFEIPVVLSGQTIGPFYGWFDKKIAKFALNRVNVITLRERFSQEILESIGVTKPIMKVTADDGTLLVPAGQEEIKEIFSLEKIPEHHLLIGMSAIGLRIFSPAELKKTYKLMAEVADHLVSKHDARVIFVPMTYSEDRVAAQEVLRFMKHTDKVRVITRECNDRIIKGIIGRMDLAIGFRYHFIVFAVNSKVPSIGFYLNDYYSMKIKGILELVEQKKYACDIEATTVRDMITLVEDIFLNKESILEKLDERTKELGKASLLSVKYAAELLSQS